MNDRIFFHQYDNGLTLVAEPIEELESAAFTFLLPIGAAYDPADRLGLSTFACEMSLRGSGSRDSRQFVSDLENLGIERGDSVSSSHTSHSGATLSRNLYPALEIYADLIRRAHLSPDQLEPARLAVEQELLAIEDEPSQKVMIELRRRHYPEPWGRPSQGEMATVKAVAVDDVRRHYELGSRPNGTILGVAGRFDWPELVDRTGRLFADWKPKPEPQVAAAPPLARQAHLEHESNQVQIGLAYDSVPYRHPDYFRAWGSVGILSGGMSARLFTEVREKRGLCYSVYATYHTLHDRGCVLCYAGTAAERAQETLDVLWGELVRLKEGVAADELVRLKARIKSALVMQQESSSSRSASLARDWYHLGYARTLDELAAIIDGLSCESINAYLAEHPPRDFTVVTLGPRPLEVPRGVS